jgi:hypothetical protein
MLDAEYLLKSILGICTEKVTIHGNEENKYFSRVKLNQHGKYKVIKEFIMIDLM